MGHSLEQWKALLGEIEASRNQRLGDDIQVATYWRHLRDISFERMRRGVEHLIKHYRGYQFPSVATIREHCEASRLEGNANADAYSQDPHHTPWSKTDEAQFCLWRQQQIESMDEDAYWQYVYDREYKRRQDRVWRQQWASMGVAR